MFEVYLISILDGLKIFLGLISGILIVAFIFKLGDYYQYGESRDNKDRMKFLAIGITLILINIFIPSTKQVFSILNADNTVNHLKENNDTSKRIIDKTVINLSEQIDQVSDTTKVK